MFASRARVTAQETEGTKQIYLYDVSEGRLMRVLHGSRRRGQWLFYPPELGSSPRTVAARPISASPEPVCGW